MPLEFLETQICELAGHLTAATCRFLLLVGDFDARRGWESWDLPSCSAWLSWKCQLSPGAAREQVRVARALRDLPVIRGEFAAGRLSYAKVRALTRIATPVTEADLTELAGPMTGAQLDRFARAHRRVSQAEDQQAQAERRVTWRWDEHDGSLAMTVRLPGASGQVLVQALRAAADDLDHPHRDRPGDQDHAPPGLGGRGASAEAPPTASDAAPGPDLPDGPARSSPQAASLADALVGLAADYLAGKITDAANPDIYQVIIHAGPEALTTTDPGPAPDAAAVPGPAGHPADPLRCHVEDGPAISPATAQRIACQATITWMLHDHDGTLLDVGRRRRKPTAAMRRAVRERDHYRCAFPGCHSRRTDLHHIQHWARGGTTSYDNLISLCQAHHIVVHERGYVIIPGQFTFIRPDGTPMPGSPALPPVTGDITGCHDAAISPATIQTAAGERMNLHHTIWAAFANARVKRERAATRPAT